MTINYQIMLFYLQTLTSVESQISSGNPGTCQREAVSDSPEEKKTFTSILKGPLTDLFEPLLRKIYSHITSSFLVSSELFHVF